jgi:hypothetical protein
MAGCYGKSAEDRYFQSLLYKYLDEQEEEEEDRDRDDEAQEEEEDAPDDEDTTIDPWNPEDLPNDQGE